MNGLLICEKLGVDLDPFAVENLLYHACVRVIAETIASLPIHVYEQTDGGSKKAVDHPLYKILHDEPNTEMTSFVWREVMLSHLLLWGNCYCQIIRSGRNKILGLYPLLPDHMEVDRDSKGQLTYTYTTNEGQAVSLRPEDVLHIPGLGFDGVMGYSPIALKKTPLAWASPLRNTVASFSPMARRLPVC